MAERDTSNEIPPSRLLLEAAEQNYEGALEEMLALRRDFRTRKAVPETEVKRVSGNYTRATQTLFDERKKLEYFAKRHGGHADDHAIDFETVRGEVGGLLDRLRAAAGSG